MHLKEFLSLECPFLLSHARGGKEALLGAIDKHCHGDPRAVLWPGVRSADAAAWNRDMLREAVEGYFRREELRTALPAEDRLLMYRVMVLTRTLDDRLKRLWQEKKVAWESYPSPQKGFRSFGQEASVGLGLPLRRGRESGDIVSLLIRGLAILLLWIDDPLHVVLAQMGKKGTPVDGRDLHVGDLARGLFPPAAPLASGAQTLVGMAYAAKMKKDDRVFLAVGGEGGTSLGEWHEAVTFAATQRLPLIFVVENNHWALGTHWSEQTAARRFALKAPGYGIPGVTIFGNDPDEVAAASAWAVERARAGKGPALVELMTYRRAGHAHHDDDRYHGGQGLKGYELEEERALWEASDPLDLYEKRLRKEKLLDRDAVEGIRAAALKRVEEAVRQAEAAPWPGREDLDGRVFAPRLEPPPGSIPPARRIMAYDEAIRQALIEAMERDPRVLVLGEDVGGRYGGAFGVTRGLARQFGPDRCLNTILAEGAIVGCGVGAALAGMRPVVEMQFADFAASGFNALVNNAAKIHWRWGRAVPLVVRLPYGGATGTLEKLLGGGPFHSQCPEAWFLRTPGWKVVAPSTPSDAKGLLTAALRDNNPVIFLEAKGLYGIFRPDLREEVPLGDFEVPLGQGIVRRQGSDVTVLTYGAMVWTALAAAETLSPEHLSLEVLDLRSLLPLDEELVARSIAKTHRVIVLHEDSKGGGPGAEIAAWIAERLLFELDGPVVRVAAPDMPAPYSPPLEHAFLPKAEDVVSAARKLVRE
jgi:2-oxoisovalerate dehydrogenase E1 component